MISRVCEEFNILPSAAIEAIENDIDDLIFKIIDLRDYVKSRELYREGQAQEDVTKRPQGPGIDRVRDIVWELNRERLAKKE